MWEAPYHRNPAGPFKAPGSVETEAQTKARYARIGAKLLVEKPDVAFLQECEPKFFKQERSRHAPEILEKYELMPCFGSAKEGDRSPGAVVLLRRGVAVPLEKMPRCIGGTNETGGESKVCSVVDALVKGEGYTFASCHFTWDGAADKRDHHVKLLEPALATRTRFVMGGDFNADTTLADVQERSWLRDAKKVQLNAPKGTFKNMPAGQNDTLDHFFVSREVSVLQADALQEPSCPYGAGSPAEVVGDSDHVPIRVVVS